MGTPASAFSMYLTNMYLSINSMKLFDEVKIKYRWADNILVVHGTVHPYGPHTDGGKFSNKSYANAALLVKLRMVRGALLYKPQDVKADPWQSLIVYARDPIDSGLQMGNVNFVDVAREIGGRIVLIASYIDLKDFEHGFIAGALIDNDGVASSCFDEDCMKIEMKYMK